MKAHECTAELERGKRTDRMLQWPPRSTNFPNVYIKLRTQRFGAIHRSLHFKHFDFETMKNYYQRENFPSLDFRVVCKIFNIFLGTNLIYFRLRLYIMSRREKGL